MRGVFMVVHTCSKHTDAKVCFLSLPQGPRPTNVIVSWIEVVAHTDITCLIICYSC